jgi:endonuclease/exonuclease/phosphatase family metal-dependent hydrolase
MRRIAPAIGPVLALVVFAVPTSPAHSSVPHATDSRVQVAQERTTAPSRSGSGIGLDSSSLGTSFVSVSWNWIKAASGYRIQVAKKADFSRVVTTKKKRNSSHRPSGGREATVVGQLRDATYYWVRVRKVKGDNASPWSSPVRVATKAHVPDRFHSARGHVGAAPGETRLSWKTPGGHTDFFRITTSLTPFGTARTPKVGRHSTTFTVPGDRRSVTLSAAQTAAAGAGIGTGRFLFFRITAVRKGSADTATRRYPFLQHTVVAGQGARGNGARLRVMQYNMHVASMDVAGHPWEDRQHLIAKNIAKVSPAIASLQELMPTMWTDYNGGVGLDAALKQAGAGRYELTRTTPYWKGNGQDTHILYDPTKLALESNCDESVPSCYILIPDPKHDHVAAYAKFRDLASGQEFYFVSAHLNTGNDAVTDALRGRQAQAISDGIKTINRQNLPVIFGTDANSSQTSAGVDSSHQVLLDEGWYNTLSAATMVNTKYNSVNHYEKQKRSPYGFGSMIDTIATLNMPGADLWKQVLTGAPWPSDHNMIYANLRLP